VTEAPKPQPLLQIGRRPYIPCYRNPYTAPGQFGVIISEDGIPNQLSNKQRLNL
jgi:hypothetical protein